VWQNSYSQLLYPLKEEIGNPPPYDPNVVIISPEVEKWMYEQFANKDVNKKVVKMKTDVLGRVKSEYSFNEVGREKVVDNKIKRLVLVSDMHLRENNMEPASGGVEYNPKTEKYDYYFNDKKVSEKEYFALEEKRREKYRQQKKSKRDLPISGVVSSDDRTWTAWMTAEEISELTKNYKEFAISDYSERETTASQASILSAIQLSTAHQWNWKGLGVGLYLNEPYCAILGNGAITNPAKYTQGDYCTVTYPEGSAHHTMVANVVQMAAPEARVYGFTNTVYPANPDLYSPPIEIGNHSYCWNDVITNVYSQHDADMDNYIYQNGVTNFVAAGNRIVDTGNNNCGKNDFFVTSPGKAFNAVTVGAVNPATNNYADYYKSNGTYWWGSKWGNPSVLNNEKPEIAMYTDIEFPGNKVYETYYPKSIFPGGFNGTSAASPLAAGFTAILFEMCPEYRGKPALTKAALLVASDAIPIQNAGIWDTDNKVAGKKILNFQSVYEYRRNRWWDGNNSDYFVNGKIEFTEGAIEANKRYRIAIAWLSSGTYIKSTQWPSQDIDLWVRQNGNVIAESRYSRNPFEVVDFVTTSNAPLTITIERFANYDKSGKILLGYHFKTFP